MRYSRAHILLLSLFLEGGLAAIFFVWFAYHGYQLKHVPSGHDLLIGFLACFPLFALNFLLFGPLSHNIPMLKSCFEFKERVVKPLADQLNAVDSFFVAFMAGIGEELFFRGVLQNEFGLVISSILFSVLHFGPSVTKYVFIALVYALIGGYFGLLYSWSQTLWVPILTHSIYDYFALLYMRYYYRSPSVHQAI